MESRVSLFLLREKVVLTEPIENQTFNPHLLCCIPFLAVRSSFGTTCQRRKKSTDHNNQPKQNATSKEQHLLQVMEKTAGRKASSEDTFLCKLPGSFHP